IDFFLVSHIAREQQRPGHGRRCQTLDVLFEALALVSESELSARFVKRQGSGPGDGALVCDSKDYSSFVFKHCFYRSYRPNRTYAAALSGAVIRALYSPLSTHCRISETRHTGNGWLMPEVITSAQKRSSAFSS